MEEGLHVLKAGEGKLLVKGGASGGRSWPYSLISYFTVLSLIMYCSIITTLNLTLLNFTVKIYLDYNVIFYYFN